MNNKRYQSKKLVFRVDTKIKKRVKLYTHIEAREGKIRQEEKWVVSIDSITCMCYVNGRYDKTLTFSEEEAEKYQKEFIQSLIDDEFEYEIFKEVEIIHYESSPGSPASETRRTIKKIEA